MRNVLIHQYEGVDLEQVRAIVERELPTLPARRRGASVGVEMMRAAKVRRPNDAIDAGVRELGHGE